MTQIEMIMVGIENCLVIAVSQIKLYLSSLCVGSQVHKMQLHLAADLSVANSLANGF